MTLASISVTC